MSEFFEEHQKQLVCGFLHEIRNPMSAVLTVAALLRDPGALPQDEISHLLEMVDDETRHMNGIINEFESFVRLPAPTMQSLDLAAVARESVQRLRAEKLLDGTLTVLDELPVKLKIIGDQEQLGEALTAILRNAAQAMQCNVSSPPQLELRLDNHDLLIRDNGEGFQRETAARAFEPYFSTRTGASGLGLTLARTLLRGQGGDVEIEPLEKTAPGAALRIILNTSRL